MRLAAAILPVLALAACKPPPTDAAIVAGDTPERARPSEPIASPDTEGAVWGNSQTPQRILYGLPGKPPMLALGCAQGPHGPVIRITRFALADHGAGAFAALIGNGHISRIPIDAKEVGGVSVWQAEIPAIDPKLEVLTGRREIAVTIPGAGRLVLNPSARPGEVVEACRALAPPPPATAPVSVAAAPAPSAYRR
ncbi:MAG: hypothetical protein ACO25F_03660 [Erythrobacter sp.]